MGMGDTARYGRDWQASGGRLSKLERSFFRQFSGSKFGFFSNFLVGKARLSCASGVTGSRHWSRAQGLKPRGAAGKVAYASPGQDAIRRRSPG